MSGKRHHKKNNSLGNARIEKYYTKIVAGFIGVTILLVLLIVYFSFSKTAITIHATQSTKTVSVRSTVEELKGMVILTDTEGTKTVTDLPAGETTIGRAGGTVTIVNKYTRNQSLVATTRLLSKEGVLFRTQKDVIVPAKGSVDVAVLADEEGEKGDIPASQFEIVALRDGLKNDIYATSAQPMTGGLAKIAVVTEEQLNTAKKELTDELLKQAQEIFADELKTREGLPTNSFLVTPVTIANYRENTANVNAGERADQFTVTQKITAAGIVLDAEEMTAFLEKNAASSIPSGSHLAAELSLDATKIELSNMNELYTNADVVLTYSIPTTIDPNHELLRSEHLTNKTKPEIDSYLRGLENVSSVDVVFSPFWLTKTPGLSDHITISIQ